MSIEFLCLLSPFEHLSLDLSSLYTFLLYSYDTILLTINLGMVGYFFLSGRMKYIDYLLYIQIKF